MLGTNLSPAKRAMLTRRRKEAYQALHPETRHGAMGTGREKSRQVDEATRFPADMAQKTRKSERAIQRDARRGESVDADILASISGTDLDKRTVLDELAKTPPEAQAAKVSAMLSRRVLRQGSPVADSPLASGSSASAPGVVNGKTAGEGSPAAKWLGGEVGLTLPFIDRYEPRRLDLAFISEAAPSGANPMLPSEKLAYEELLRGPNAKCTNLPLCDAIAVASHALQFANASPMRRAQGQIATVE